MGRYYAEAQGEDEAVAHASRITTSRRGRTIWCRPIRCRSPSRSPTRSTRWSASGRSTKSRPAAKDPLCAAARGARRHPHRHRKRIAAAAAPAALAALQRRFAATKIWRKQSPCCMPLNEQIINLSATDIELAVKLEVLVSAKAQAGGRPGAGAGAFLSATDARSARLLRRPPEGAAARGGARHDLVDAVFRARRPGRFADDRAPGRGAGKIPRHRRRQEPARRRQARLEHPAHRGEEGQQESTPARPTRSVLPRRKKKRWPKRSTSPRRKPPPPSPRRTSPPP